MSGEHLSIGVAAEQTAARPFSKPSPNPSSGLLWALAAMSACLILLAYRESLAFLIQAWVGDENYNHGLFVPIISAYLIYLHRHQIATRPIEGQGWGLVVMLMASVVFVVGELATLYSFLHLSFFLCLIGLVIIFQGHLRAAAMSFPLSYLLTAIPLPMFLYQAVTGKLQLMSSALGVACLQAVGVTAFQEGNVIDLGAVQLQVVEACSGLRYLFPLMSLALLGAYLMRDRWWKRVVLVLSSIPISILLNGLRIGLIGVLVEYQGASAAEGFLHLFEGWLLFLCSIGLLCAEAWILSKCGPSMSTRSIENQQSQHQSTRSSPVLNSPRAGSTAPVIAGLLLAGLLVIFSFHFGGRNDLIPARQTFLDFPSALADWTGQAYPLETTYLNALRLDDYYLADFHNPTGQSMNVYLAYYASQRKGQSAHSPKSCIPGGGWEIVSMDTRPIPVQGMGAAAFPVNRVLVKRSSETQLVYYWFKQRNRNLSNEFLVKWFLFWDALTRQRTDGALIRLAMSINRGESEPDADRHLSTLATAVAAQLRAYVPD